MTNRDLPIEYGAARAAARLSHRLTEANWRSLAAAHNLAALLDVARTTAFASYVSGIDADDSLSAIDHAFRQQLRSRIDEAVAWAPAAWTPAIAYTQVLVDLPALVHLVQTANPARWMLADSSLSPIARLPIADRRVYLAGTDVAPLLPAIEASDASTVVGLHPALIAWAAEWQQRWPRTGAAERDSLGAVVQVVSRHLRAFAATDVGAAPALRLALAARASSIVRQSAALPAALIAWLLVLALDLERLRALVVARWLEAAQP